MRAARVDRNQAEIVEALRAAGATVQLLHTVGEGCPDLAVGYAGQTAFVEVKDGMKPLSAQRLTPEQQKWHADWKGGTLAIVRDVEGALRVLKVMAA